MIETHRESVFAFANSLPRCLQPLGLGQARVGAEEANPSLSHGMGRSQVLGAVWPVASQGCALVGRWIGGEAGIGIQLSHGRCGFPSQIPNLRLLVLSFLFVFLHKTKIQLAKCFNFNLIVLLGEGLTVYPRRGPLNRETGGQPSLKCAFLLPSPS